MLKILVSLVLFFSIVSLSLINVQRADASGAIESGGTLQLGKELIEIISERVLKNPACLVSLWGYAEDLADHEPALLKERDLLIFANDIAGGIGLDCLIGKEAVDTSTTLKTLDCVSNIIGAKTGFVNVHKSEPGFSKIRQSIQWGLDTFRYGGWCGGISGGLAAAAS